MGAISLSPAGRGWLLALALLLSVGCDRAPAPARSSSPRPPRPAAGVLSEARFHLPRTEAELARFIPAGVSEKRLTNRLGRPFLVVPIDDRLCTLYYVYEHPLPAEEPGKQITGFTLLLEAQRVKEATLSRREEKKTRAEAPPEVDLGRQWVTFNGLRQGGNDCVAPARVRVAMPEVQRDLHVPVRVELAPEIVTNLNARIARQKPARIELEIQGVSVGALSGNDPLPRTLTLSTTNITGVMHLIRTATESP